MPSINEKLGDQRLLDLFGLRYVLIERPSNPQRSTDDHAITFAVLVEGSRSGSDPCSHGICERRGHGEYL